MRPSPFARELVKGIQRRAEKGAGMKLVSQVSVYFSQSTGTSDTLKHFQGSTAPALLFQQEFISKLLDSFDPESEILFADGAAAFATENTVGIHALF